MATLEELGKTLTDVELGGSSAESDEKLFESFVDTQAARDLRRGKRFLVLGRKGSGKSALFALLPSILRGDRVLVAQATSSDFAWNAMSEFSAQGLQMTQAHGLAWEFTLLTEIASRLAQSDILWHEDVRRAAREIRTFIVNNFGEEKFGQFTPSARLLSGLSSINLTAFGNGVGFTRSDKEVVTPITVTAVELLKQRLLLLLREQPVVLELDRLDDGWDGSETSKSMLIGLLKAAKRLNDLFRMNGAKESRIIVFLRTDIYDALEFDEIDKMRSFESRIEWQESDLEELVARRLPTGVTAQELFEQKSLRGKTSPFAYLLRRTFARPREVIQFIELCIAESEGWETFISKARLTQSSSQFSSWKLDDTKKEYAKADPVFTPLVSRVINSLTVWDDGICRHLCWRSAKRTVRP